tara:strand:+ start:371 stop:571 length:201 start_codon:yes stop_codon:yes gene_type:complete
MYKKTNFNDCRIESNQMAEFFILPTYSYFGDFNILMNLRSQIQYKAAEGDLGKITVLMTLDKQVLD